MKQQVKRFKNLTSCLKELEPFIINGQHLQTGRPFKNFGGLLSREILGNWLLCAVANHAHQTEKFTFSTDPQGGDGIIVDTASEHIWPTEHVLVPKVRRDKTQNTESRILEAICGKQQKGGAAYASGKTLVVFLDAGGEMWHPNSVARQLPSLDFDEIWVVGLQHANESHYVYAATQLDVSQGNAPIWRIQIPRTFTEWTIEQIQ